MRRWVAALLLGAVFAGCSSQGAMTARLEQGSWWVKPLSSQPTAKELLLRQQAPQARCAVRVDTGSPEALRHAVRALVQCARSGFAPIAEAINVGVPDPVTQVSLPEDVAEECRPDESYTVGEFCPGVSDLIWIDPSVGDDNGDFPFAVADVVFHEYAHAIQSQVGIDGWDAADHVDQRTELQAVCWGAMYVRTMEGWNGTPEQRSALLDYEADGADEVHGTEASIRYWTDKGLHTPTFRTCDTWSAPADEVT